MSTALATTNHTASLNAYEPGSFEQAWSLAKIVAESGLSPGLTTPARAFVALATGAMLGVPAMAAVNQIHIIEGRAAPSSILLVAKVMASGLCEYWEILETDETHCVIETKRKGARKPVQVRFDLAEAQRAGLVKDKSNYQKWPADMCVARAGSRLVRRVYPDLAQGLYSREEIDGGELPPDALNLRVDAQVIEMPKPKAEVQPAQTVPAPAPADPTKEEVDAEVGEFPEEAPAEAADEEETRPWAKAMLDAAKAGCSVRDLTAMANTTVKAGTALKAEVEAIYNQARTIAKKGAAA